MSVVEVLRKMEELLAVPERWTQGYYARDRRGCQIAFEDVDAVCWCLAGAALKVSGGVDNSVESALQATACCHGYCSYVSYNDTPGRTHEEVLSLIRETRERLEAV